MQNKVLIACIALTVFLGGVMLTAQQGEQLPRITIVNNTGVTISAVMICESGGLCTGNRLAPNQTILNRQSAALDLPYPLRQVNRYDIILLDTEGNAYTRENIRVRAGIRITITSRDRIN